MSPACQAKLLRFLKSGAIRPLGSDDERVLDVRIVAATHRDLRAMIQSGSFREDLYYRLAGDELHVPPLRERPEDIPDLVAHFLADSHRLMARTGLELSPEAMDVLKSCRWPGNVRQLRNVVHRAAVHGGAAAMTADELLAFLPAEDLPPREEWGVQRQLGRDFTTTILEYLRENGKTSAIELKKALNLRRTTFFRNVKPLLTHGLVESSGKGRATQYQALEVTPSETNAAPESAPASSPFSSTVDQTRWQLLLGIIEKEGRITRARFMEATGLPTRTASRFLIRFVDEGLLKDDGQKGRAKGYTKS